MILPAKRLTEFRLTKTTTSLKPHPSHWVHLQFKFPPLHSHFPFIQTLPPAHHYQLSQYRYSFCPGALCQVVTAFIKECFPGIDRPDLPLLCVFGSVARCLSRTTPTPGLDYHPAPIGAAVHSVQDHLPFCLAVTHWLTDFLSVNLRNKDCWSKNWFFVQLLGPATVAYYLNMWPTLLEKNG